MKFEISQSGVQQAVNSKNRRNHQTEAGGHFLVEVSAYLACRAPRLALDVFTPSKWAGLLVGCGEPKALPECGLGNSVGQVSHVFGFLGLFLKK